MQSVSLLVKRNLHVLSSHQSLLVFGAPDPELLRELGNCFAATYDYMQYRSYRSLTDHCSFGPPETDLSFDAVLLFMPKAKDELKYTLSRIANQLDEGATVYLVGEKKAGVASAAKLISQLGKDLSKLDAAKHCQIFQVSVEQAPKPFSEKDWFQYYELEHEGGHLKLCCLPGVFSFGRLDDGTALLLNNLPKKLKGRVLDFACGNGVIGLVVKQRFPDIELEQVDTSWIALQCARRSAEINSLSAKIYPSDGWSEVEGRVDAVVTNPPFHQGIKTAYNTTEDFITQSKDKLTKNAPLLLVANNFLRYPPLIERTLGSCYVLGENTRFRVYTARR